MRHMSTILFLIFFHQIFNTRPPSFSIKLLTDGFDESHISLWKAYVEHLVDLQSFSRATPRPGRPHHVPTTRGWESPLRLVFVVKDFDIKSQCQHRGYNIIVYTDTLIPYNIMVSYHVAWCLNKAFILIGSYQVNVAGNSTWLYHDLHCGSNSIPKA